MNERGAFIPEETQRPSRREVFKLAVSSITAATATFALEQKAHAQTPRTIYTSEDDSALTNPFFVECGAGIGGLFAGSIGAKIAAQEYTIYTTETSRRKFVRATAAFAVFGAIGSAIGAVIGDFLGYVPESNYSN